MELKFVDIRFTELFSSGFLFLNDKAPSARSNIGDCAFVICRGRNKKSPESYKKCIRLLIPLFVQT